MAFKNYFLGFVLCASARLGWAQRGLEAIPTGGLSVQVLTVAYHPLGSINPNVLPWKLDKRGLWVVTPGLVLNWDTPLSNNAFLRSSNGFYRDCAGLKAAFMHLGARFSWHWGRHSLNAGIGPTFLIREDWHRFDSYIGEDIYGKKVWRGWQYCFVPHGGEIEYRYTLASGKKLQISLIPAYPILFALKAGLQWPFIKAKRFLEHKKLKH